MSITSGHLIGDRYRLLKHIGHGGMGDVWRAQDATLDRPVAVKILSETATRERDTKAFLLEARMAAAVRHRNVVEVLDYGTHESGAPYIVMELLEGETLGDVFYREGRLSFDEVVSIIVGALHGLAAAHDAGIVHRDLKPENIFLAEDRDALFPKLLDFGISKSLDADRPSPVVTQEGRVVGTPAYMSPEQARGLRDIDHRTDLYSMGIILYEALVGEPPFFDENPGDLMVKIITAPTPRVDEQVPAAGEVLGDFVARAMHRVPELRFQSADEMRRELEFLATNRVGAREISSLQKHARPAPWRRSQQAPRVNDKQLDRASGKRAIKNQQERVLRWTLWVAGVALALAAVLFLAPWPKDVPKPYVIKVNPANTAAASSPPPQPPEPLPSPVRPESEPPPSETTAPEEAEAPSGTDATRRRVNPRRRTAPTPRQAKQPTSSADRLSMRFQGQKAAIVRCLQVGDVTGQANMAIRFAIDRSGSVTRVSVLPADLAQTSTGACMRKAAKAMQFGKQERALTFRIPLRARSAQ